MNANDLTDPAIKAILDRLHRAEARQQQALDTTRAHIRLIRGEQKEGPPPKKGTSKD